VIRKIYEGKFALNSMVGLILGTLALNQSSATLQFGCLQKDPQVEEFSDLGPVTLIQEEECPFKDYESVVRFDRYGKP
jgi:hypothetical protein